MTLEQLEVCARAPANALLRISLLPISTPLWFVSVCYTSTVIILAKHRHTLLLLGNSAALCPLRIYLLPFMYYAVQFYSLGL